MGRAIRHAPQPFEIRFVFGKEKVFRIFAMQFIGAELKMCCFDHRWCALVQCRLARIATPAPGIPKPKGGEEVQVGWLGATIGHGRANEDIVRTRLSECDLDIEVTLLTQDIRVPEFELRLHSRSTGIATN